MADTARQPLEEPHVAHRGRQGDVAQPLAAHLGLRHLDAALVADHAAVLHALVLAAQALPVGNRPEDLGAEQAVAFGLEGPVVDRLGLGHFAKRPGANLLRRSQGDPDGVEVRPQCRLLIRETWSHALHLLQHGFAFTLWEWLGWFTSRRDQLHVETERLQLADEHVERFRQAGREGRVALDDGLVDLGAAGHVVGLGRQQLLENVCRAVGLERPHFHFAEALAAELGLAAQRLLRDQRVRPDRPRVDLVVDQVAQLQHVDVADRDLLLERLTGHAVIQLGLAAFLLEACLIEPADDFLLGGAVEHRRREVQAERMRRPSEVRFEDLADVHTRRHAQRIEHDLHRRSIRQIRHVLLGQDARDDALVAMAAGHLVADRQLALHRHVDLDQLDHTGRQFVAAANLFLLLFEQLLDDLDLTLGAFFHHAQIGFQRRVIGLDLRAHEREERHLGERLHRQLIALLQQALAAELVEQISAQDLPLQHVDDALLRFVMKDANLVLQVLFHHVELVLLDRLGAVVLLDALAREDLDADDDALDARRADQRGVAHVAGLFAEDRAEQLLFRRQLGLALRRDLADQDVARLDRRADADDAAVVEIAQVAFRHVRDVARDFFRTQLGIARFDLELLDVDRGVVVLANELFAHQNRVFEVVAAPRHERDQHVTAERELAEFRARTVSQDLALLNALADPNDRLLVDAGVLVRPLELGHRIDIRAHVLVDLASLRFHAHHDARRIDEVDET